MTAIPIQPPMPNQPTPTASPGPGSTANVVGAWGGGAGILGIATWAMMSLSGFQDEVRSAQTDLQLKVGRMASDVSGMAKSIAVLEKRSDQLVTESQMRDFVKMKLLEYEHTQSVKGK